MSSCREPYAGAVAERSGTIGAVFDRSVDADPTRPLVTFYDHAAGERVELSGATVRNWVDKTANLLTDVLGASAGSQVSVALPTHWQTLVWVTACWRIGAVVVSGEATPDVAVIGPATTHSGRLPAAGEVVATSLHPLGARFDTPLPVGVTDYGSEVFAQGDRFTATVPVRADTPAWQASRVFDHASLIEHALAAGSQLGLHPGVRLLTDANPATLAGALTAVLAPLLVDGSVVLVRHPDPAQLRSLATVEHVDVTAVEAATRGAAAG